MENKNILGKEDIGRSITYYELAEIVCRYADLNSSIIYAKVMYNNKIVVPIFHKPDGKKVVFSTPRKDGPNCMEISHARKLKPEWNNYVVIMPKKKRIVSHIIARVERIISKYSEKPITCLEIELVMD